MYKNVTEIKEPDGYDLKAWALYYASLGLKVFPLVPRGKVPIKNTSYVCGTDDVNQIEKWWNENPNYNIGLATGKASGVIVIDLDEDEDKNKHGVESLKEWEDENGKLPDTCGAITGRGGYHLFYRLERDCKKREDILNGIDLRADKSHCVLPPSIHPNGKRYEWEYGLCDLEMADVTENIMKLLLYKKESGDGGDGEGVGVDQFVIESGCRVSTLISMIGTMRKRGMCTEAIWSAIQIVNKVQCKPPVSEKEMKEAVKPCLKRDWRRGEHNKNGRQEHKFDGLPQDW